MIISLIIALRETLEAALIVGIILSYLTKLEAPAYKRYVFYGIIAGVLTSILGAIAFNATAEGFSGTSEAIFEGIVMIIGSLMISTMILWMMRQSNKMGNLHDKVDLEIKESHKWGIFSLVFISVLREGIELVIFLAAATFDTGENSLLGAGIGMAIAILLGYAIFKGSVRFNLKNFFIWTGIFLIFVAAGLLAHGIHELQEAGIVPIVIEHIYDINPILDEKGTLGNFLKGLFGYNGNPSLVETIAYGIYMIVTIAFWKRNTLPKKSSIDAPEAPEILA
jgi:high-affinity iron transporter